MDNDEQQHTTAGPRPEDDEAARIAAAQEEPGRASGHDASGDQDETDSASAVRTQGGKIERSTRAPGEKR